MIWKRRAVAARFRVHCHAGDAGQFEVTSNSVILHVGQQIRDRGREEMWDSLRIECREQENDSLAIEIVISHPTWEKPLRIVHIESAPTDNRAEEPTLGFDLEQIPL